MGRDLQTAHVRHGDVADHDFWRLQPGQGQPRPAVVRDRYLVPGESEQHRHAVGQIPVVVDEQDASTWLHHRAAQGLPAAGMTAGIFRRSGRRTTNSLPWPNPALAACTQPPCSSIIFRTRARPIPNPSPSRLGEPFTWVNSSKIARQHGRFDPDARVAHSQDGLAASRLNTPDQCDRPLPNTWRCCSEGLPRLEPAGTGLLPPRPPAREVKPAGRACGRRCGAG